VPPGNPSASRQSECLLAIRVPPGNPSATLWCIINDQIFPETRPNRQGFDNSSHKETLLSPERHLSHPSICDGTGPNRTLNTTTDPYWGEVMPILPDQNDLILGIPPTLPRNQGPHGGQPLFFPVRIDRLLHQPPLFLERMVSLPKKGHSSRS